MRFLRNIEVATAHNGLYVMCRNSLPKPYSLEYKQGSLYLLRIQSKNIICDCDLSATRFKRATKLLKFQFFIKKARQCVLMLRSVNFISTKISGGLNIYMYIFSTCNGSIWASMLICYSLSCLNIAKPTQYRSFLEHIREEH